MLVTRYVVYHVNNGQDWSMNPIWNLLTPLYTTLSHSNTVYWLIDWLVFNTNFSSISSILWHEHFLYYTTINIGSRPQQPLLYNNTILRFKCCCCWCRYIFFFTSDTPQIFVKDDNKYLWCYWSPFYIPVWADCGVVGPIYGFGVGVGSLQLGIRQQESVGSITSRQFTGISKYWGHLKEK